MVYGYREGFAAIAVMEVVTMLRVSLWALALGLCAVVSVTSMIAGFPWILVCIPAWILGID
jgi:hypothetical protein